MNRIIFFFIFSPLLCCGQIENRWQPDSIYLNRQIKKIFGYLNSPRDLSIIVEFDKTGKRIRSTVFSASYNRQTRKSKRIEKIWLYEYDSFNRLIRIVDSLGTDSTVFKYGKNDKVSSSRKSLGNFVYETKYTYNPLKLTTIRKIDSIIVYEKTKEYDKDFYVSRFYGFYLEPKLRKVTDTINGIPSTLAYKDYSDLQRFEDNEIIKNNFDSNARLIKSYVRSVFMNDRLNEYELNYNYYKNGLLKSIHGFVPRYFKYESWE